MKNNSQKTALVTGSAGFVGGYLTKLLTDEKFKVFGTRLGHEKEAENTFILDINDYQNILKVLEDSKPDWIFHLAGFSSVGQSADQAELCMKINYEGTRNLLNASREKCPEAKILIIGSSEVYGKPDFLPITEEHPLKGENPYALSRIKQSTLLDEFKDLKTYWTRSFNHSGPGQRLGFVIPDFASQVAQIKLGKLDKKIFVGNLEVERDFSDVRDVVKAYFDILDKGDLHNFYNVCSGKAVGLRDILNQLIFISGIKAEVVVDETKYRKNDVIKYYGSYNKLYNKTGWKPEISIQKTLKDTFEHWLQQNSTI